MTLIVQAQFKCSHCGAINKDSYYRSWNNFDGSEPGRDIAFGVCGKCNKEYNKGKCFIRELEDDDEDGDLGIPAFIKQKMNSKSSDKRSSGPSPHDIFQKLITKQN